jgi:parallel beta-helix repeat protein
MNSSRTFTVMNDLTSSSASGCLVINAPNVVLDTHNHSMTGNGAGIGIHVKSTAVNAFIEASAQATVLITGFATGVQDDANGMTIDAAAIDGNSDVGVMINGASNSSVDDSNINGIVSGSAQGIGVLILNGSGNQVHDCDADHNTSYGVEINGGSNNAVIDSNAAHDGKYGIWIRGSSGNRVQDATANSNGNTGIYIGCADTAGPGGSCSTPGTGSKNVIQHGHADSNGVNGIGVDSDDLQNQIGHSHAGGNGTEDLIDENTSCATNLWFLNSFSTASQICIN